MSQQHKQLTELQSERDKLQDEAAGLTKDDIVDQARVERDDAIAKYVYLWRIMMADQKPFHPICARKCITYKSLMLISHMLVNRALYSIVFTIGPSNVLHQKMGPFLHSVIVWTGESPDCFTYRCRNSWFFSPYFEHRLICTSKISFCLWFIPLLWAISPTAEKTAKIEKKYWKPFFSLQKK